MTGFGKDNEFAEVKFILDRKGVYDLVISYCGDYGEKISYLYINGQLYGEVFFKPSAAFVDLNVGKVTLKSGENTVRIVKFWNWYHFDRIQLLKAGSGPKLQLSKKLVNRKASKEAKALMSFLVDNYGRHVLSGQQHGIDTQDFETIKQKTGKHPAIGGFDLIDYSPSRVAHGTVGKDVEAALNWWKKGGIVTFAWHWNAPSGLIDTEENRWWSGFFTRATTFDLEKALKKTSTKEYKLLLRDIDVIARQLKKLKKAKVPVLFRPLHEADSGWFWWGAKGPGPCKQLYKILFDRLTKKHKLNNLIWVWNSPKTDWYPGDNYVDIISCNIYGPGRNYNPNSSNYQNLALITKRQKLIALAENGVIPDPDKMKETDTNWAWFCTWNGEFVTDEKYTEAGQLRKVYNHEYVLTLDELPDLKKYPIK